jgi:hypothetical protein
VELEWSIVKIVTHQNSGTDALFQVQWGMGDQTWLPYANVKGLHALEDYFEALRITRIGQLKEALAPEQEGDVEIATAWLGPTRQNLGGGKEKENKKQVHFVLETQQPTIAIHTRHSHTLHSHFYSPSTSTMVRQMENICILNNGNILVWNPISRKLMVFDQKQVRKIFEANLLICRGKAYDDNFYLPAGYNHFATA